MAQKKSIDDGTVLEKALLVISKHGPDNFTLSDISKSVGLSPATLLQRFGSKQQLLIRAAKQANIKLKIDLEALTGKQLHWDEELIQFLIQMPEGFGSREDIANSLSVLKLDMLDPELHPIARELFDSIRNRIQELLLQGLACAELNPCVDIKTILWELDALRHGFVIQWTLSGKGTLEEWIKKGFVHYLNRIKK